MLPPRQIRIRQPFVTMSHWSEEEKYTQKIQRSFEVKKKPNVEFKPEILREKKQPRKTLPSLHFHIFPAVRFYVFSFSEKNFPFFSFFFFCYFGILPLCSRFFSHFLIIIGDVVLSLLSCSTNSSNSLLYIDFFFIFFFFLNFIDRCFFSTCFFFFYTFTSGYATEQMRKKNRPSHFAFYLFSVFYYWFFDILDGEKRKKWLSACGVRICFFFFFLAK